VVAFSMFAGSAAARSTTTVSMTAHLTVVKLAAAKLPNASGHFAGTLLKYSNGRSKLTWTLSYKNLGAAVTTAQVLVPATKNQGAISIQLCRRCQVSSHGVVTPILRRSTTALLTRRAFVVVSTKKYPSGAIRGQIARKG
jgi:hypothetical protein